jgi:hypothetical protein
MTKLRQRTRTSLWAALTIASLSMGCASTQKGQAAEATRTDHHQPSGDQTMHDQIESLMQTYQRSLNEGGA